MYIVPENDGPPHRYNKNRTAEVFLGEHGVGAHGDVPGLPVGRAHLSMLFHELEGFDQANDFVHVAAHRKIIDGYLPDRFITFTA